MHHHAQLALTFKERARFFAMWLYLGSSHGPHVGVVLVCPPSPCEVTSHWGFTLHFFNDYGWSLLLCSQYLFSFFGELSVEIFYLLKDVCLLTTEL